MIGANLEFPAAFSLVSTLDKGQTPVTNDIFIQHLKGVPATAEILFEGRLLRRGRTMAWAESQAMVDGKASCNRAGDQDDPHRLKGGGVDRRRCRSGD